MLKKIAAKLGFGETEKAIDLKTMLLKGAASLFGLKFFSAGCGFLISMILARILKASDYGLYIYVFLIMDMLILLGTAGADTLMVRNVAIYKTNSQWGLLHGLYKWTHQLTMIISVILIIITIIILNLLGDKISPPMYLCFLISLLFVPIASIRNINIAGMNGLKEFIKAHTPEFFIRPIFFITTIIITYLILRNKVNAPIICGIQVLIALIPLTIIIISLRKSMPKIVWQETPQYDGKTWLTSALFLLFYSSFGILYSNVDSLMLGAMKGVALVGIYDAAVKGRLIIYMVYNAIAGVLQPNIASLYAQGKYQEMEQLVMKSGRILFGIITCMSLGLIIFSKWYMALFGEEFIQGQLALIMLCLVALIDNFAPFNMLLLNMTGHEKYTMIGMAISSILNVFFNYLWIPKWGLVGLISATTVSLFALNLYATILVYHKFKINCTILPSFKLTLKA